MMPTRPTATAGDIRRAMEPAVHAAAVPLTLFSAIARSYDGPAQALSLLQYRRWHRQVQSEIGVEPPARILDMATGTGAIALRLGRQSGMQVVGADVTREMLSSACERALSQGVRLDLLECTAEMIPFRDGVFDAVVFSYLLRYVSDVAWTVRQLADLVRPGGRLVSLEFAVPSGIPYPLWRLYTDLFLPVAGAAFAANWRRVGSFLGPSIRDFYRRWPEDRLVDLWYECGLRDVRVRHLSLGGAMVMSGTRA
ncbi:MAG: class I SAM-dependent methyltransferase [Dehalococcoidia bacterium]